MEPFEETVRDPSVDGAIVFLASDEIVQDLSHTEALISPASDETVQDPSDEKLMYNVVLQLDEMHELYEKLLWDAEQWLLKVYDSAATGEGRDLGAEIENTTIWWRHRRYLILLQSPSPLLPIFALPVSCLLPNPEDEPTFDADSSCVIDRQVLDMGQGCGGHLGLGHKNSLIVPTKNHNIDNLRSIVLGGIHSVALTTHDNVFTSWYSSSIPPSHLKGLSRTFSQLL
ncbi:hypothetical protein ACLOJK_003286 [Asimina triloba]